VGDRSSSSYIYQRFVLLRCFNNGCKDNETITNYLAWANLKVITLNKYYDEATPSQPVKEYLDVHEIYNLENGNHGEVIIRLSKHEVKYLNKSTEVFYNVDYFESHKKFKDTREIQRIGVTMGKKNYLYEQYNDYKIEPSSARRLETSQTQSTEVEDIDAYY
jgi:hypothetical protein